VTTAAKPLRADAERNRRLLLDAAAACFAERGLDVSVAEIARRAGVGHGTAFRRFPTKEHLVSAVVLDRIEAITALAGDLLEDGAVDDPLLEFMRRTIEMQVQDRGLGESIGTGVLADEGVQAAHSDLLTAIERLVRRAQERGQVRDDISAVDVIVLTKGVTAAAAPLLAVKPRIWRRYLDLARDALRPEAAHPLTGRPPTRAELDRGLAECH
jgi:AcrR family transcriptional regulator